MFEEEPSRTRSAFQRDRDRILHSHRFPSPRPQDTGVSCRSTAIHFRTG